jgi:hypothetical protein
MKEGLGVAEEKPIDREGDTDEAASPQQDEAAMAGVGRLAIQRGMRRLLADPLAPLSPVSDQANSVGDTDDLQASLSTRIGDDVLTRSRVLAAGKVATPVERLTEPADLSLVSSPREPSGQAQIALPTEPVTPSGQFNAAQTSSAPDSAFSSSEEPVAPPQPGGPTQISSTTDSAFSSFTEPAAATLMPGPAQVPSASDSAVPSAKKPVVPPESTLGPSGGATSKPVETQSVDDGGQELTP